MPGIVHARVARQLHQPIVRFARTRKGLTAWLGLVAMVLVLFVPMVSQALELHELRTSERVAPLCETKQSAPANTDLPAGHDMPVSHHAACGYCDLLAEHVLVPTIIPAATAPAPIHATAWSPEPGCLAVYQVREAGRPRDSSLLF